MEDRILTLRQQGTQTIRGVRQRARYAVIFAGAAAVLAVGFVVYRATRPPTTRQRIERLIPDPLWRLRDAIELGWRRTIPPMRLYVGDRQVGEEPASSTMEKVAVRAAQAFGTAAASALAARLLQRVTNRDR